MFNGVGGSMILYTGDWPRMTPSDFRVRTLDGVGDDWPLTYEELEPFYDRIAREVGVSGLAGDPAYPEGADLPLPPLPLGDGIIDVVRAHDRLGWHWWPAPNAILSAPYRGRHPCAQWGSCMQGCPEGAKASTDITHWPQAIDRGARVVTGARVTRLLHRAREASHAALSTSTRTGRCTSPRRTSSCSPRTRSAPRACCSLSASAEFPDGSGEHERPRRAATDDAPVRRRHRRVRAIPRDVERERRLAHPLPEFYETDASRGFARGAKWSMAPSTGGPLNAAMPARAGEAVWGEGHHRLVKERFGHCLSWGIFGEDLPEERNRVELDAELVDAAGLPAPRIVYTTAENSRRLLDFHVARARESLLEAGASRVDALSPMRDAGWHILGTARMGRDPASSVVNPWGKTHEVDNLYVVDGSVFVTSGGVNPTNTISSLALRFADGLVERRSAAAGARVSLDDVLRERLARLADGLIPGVDGMPAPSSLDIGGRQLDVVLTSRPDLAGDLGRALAAAAAVDDAIAWVETVRAEDPVRLRRARHGRRGRLLPASGGQAPARLPRPGARADRRRHLSRLRGRGPAGAGVRARAHLPPDAESVIPRVYKERPTE